MARAAAAAEDAAAAAADGTSAPAAAVRGIRGAPGTWRRVRRAAQEASAHPLLLCFTTLLSLKLDGVFSRSWWMVFIPLWLFHAVVARPCSNKCQSCPICRVVIESKLSISDAVVSADPLCDIV